MKKFFPEFFFRKANFSKTNFFPVFFFNKVEFEKTQKIFPEFFLEKPIFGKADFIKLQKIFSGNSANCRLSGRL